MKSANPQQTQLIKRAAQAERPHLAPGRTVHWMGSVNYDNFYEVTDRIRALQDEQPSEAINLVVTSPGGATGIAMSFHDSMKTIYKPKLYTVGSGDVDSSGIIIL